MAWHWTVNKPTPKAVVIKTILKLLCHLETLRLLFVWLWCHRCSCVFSAMYDVWVWWWTEPVFWVCGSPWGPGHWVHHRNGGCSCNSLTHWPLGDLKEIFKLILMIHGWGISSEIVLTWTAQDITDDKSTLVQVMAWCHQATSHYLIQCWPSYLSPCGVTRPQWVKVLKLII